MPKNTRVVVTETATVIHLVAGEHDGEPSEKMYDILEAAASGNVPTDKSLKKFALSLCKQMDEAIFEES